MSDLAVSVVIPVFNGERYLAEAIESALSQTHPPHQVIVVDDGSTDCSADIAASHNVTIIRQPNRGAAAARNAGIAAASGDCLAFLDADDVWLPTKLQRQVERLKSLEADICFAYMTHVCEPGTNRPNWEQSLAESGTPVACFLPSSWVVLRTSFESVGPFNDSYRIGEDTEWYLRARRAGLAVAVVEEPLLMRRIHDANLTVSRPEVRSALLRVLRAGLPRDQSQ